MRAHDEIVARKNLKNIGWADMTQTQRSQAVLILGPNLDGDTNKPTGVKTSYDDGILGCPRTFVSTS